MIDKQNYMKEVKEAYDNAIYGAMEQIKQLIDAPSDEAYTRLQIYIEEGRSVKQAERNTSNTGAPDASALPVIDWDKYPPEYKWFAFDLDGRGFIYTDMPVALHGKLHKWQSYGRNKFIGDFTFATAFTGFHWNLTLTYRPNQPPVVVIRDPETGHATQGAL